MDNIHVPKCVELNGHVLKITLDDDYIVIVDNPEKIIVEDSQFIIRCAQRVRYEYGHYGMINEKIKYFREYTLTEGCVVKTSGKIDGTMIMTVELLKGNYPFEIC